MCHGSRVLRLFARSAAATIALTFALAAGAQNMDGGAENGADDAESGDAGPITPPEDPSGPRWHFRVPDPATLNAEEAERIYARLRVRMARRYRLSRLAKIRNYQKWRRYNRVPYRSVTHGQRYVNNYANPAARSYGRFENAGRMPVGAIVAKDSFTVTAGGRVSPGPLFVMEKMPEGFSYVGGDWLYTMVMPDGSLFGQSNGPGAKRMEFCIACHLAVEQQDHLFLIPKKFRAHPDG